MTAIRTSRIGRKPIPVPGGVDIKIQDQKITVKGSKGTLSFDLHPFVIVKIENNTVTVEPNASKQRDITGQGKKLFKSIVGTVRANLFNMIHGVSTGYERKLTLVGVGYRAAAKGKILGLSLGYSHPTDYSLPEGVVAETPTQTEIILKGANKELVGQAAAEIRSMRSPEPYKGKGVRYAEETVELKETKKK